MAFHGGFDWDVLAQLAVALGIGGLIGLERERHHREKSVLAGVRTLPLVSMSGVLSVRLAEETGEPWVLVAGLVVFGALSVFLTLGKQEEGAAGLTTPVAFVATFLLGTLVGYDQLLLAIVGGVATTLLLFSKDRLHHLADVLTEEELRGAIMFIVLAFILYPLAPADGVGPDGVVGLRQALLIVILVSGLSFVSFLAMRKYGPQRGLPLMGFLGGLANSMAAAGAIAGLDLRGKALKRSAAIGFLAAGSAMLVRNLAIAAIADPRLQLVALLSVPFGAMLLLLGLAAWRVRSRQDGGTASSEELPHILTRSPFAIGPALKFGVLFLLLSVAAHYLSQIGIAGGAAVYLTAIGGLVATGPVVASMAVLASQGGLPPETAATVSVIAVCLSLSVKGGLARGADPEIARPVLPAVVGAVVVGLAVTATLRIVT